MSAERISFVVRLWLEPGPEGERRWQGHIQHVQSGRDLYFRDLDRMLDFLAEVGGVAFAASAGPPEARPSEGGSGCNEEHLGGAS